MRTRPYRWATFLSALCLSAAAAAAADPGKPVLTSDTAFLAPQRELSFEDLGLAYPLRLRTVFGQASVPLNIRADQVVTDATLTLRYSHSPSLRFDTSHINVLVNDQLVRTIPLTAESASGAVAQITLNPLLLVPKTQIRLELIAHYARNECEDPTHSSLWAEISNESSLKLSFSTLPPPPSLERLPAPLFDDGESGLLTLPFVFERSPTAGQMKAAAIVAAWFGAKADYRGADFPVRYGTLPPGHGVVFTTRAQSFPGLDPAAVSTRPSIAMVENPDVPQARLLVISAATDEGLVQAAQGLALSQLLMEGRNASIDTLQLPEARQAWSSGRWINPEAPRPLTDGALNPLSVTGLMPGPISFEFALPPDLYPLDRDSVKLRLKYRAAPITGANSALNAVLNAQFAGGVAIDATALGKSLGESRELTVDLPSGVLRTNNRLDAQFHFRRNTDAVCQDFDPNSLQGSIDPASKLEFKSYAHFAEMPALQLFAQGAYPYSRLGDLGGTALILPQGAQESEVSAALILAGHIGRWTQDAATRLEVGGFGNVSEFADRDLLVIGRAGELPVPQDWAGELPLLFDNGKTELRPVDLFDSLHERLAGRNLEQASEYASRVVMQAGQDFEAIMGFESPLKSGRNVVVLAAGSQGNLRDAALAVTKPGQAQFVRGGLTLVQGDKVSGYDLGNGYEVGSLPWWYGLKRWLGLRPYLMLPLTLLVVLLSAVVLRLALRRRAELRLKGKL